MGRKALDTQEEVFAAGEDVTASTFLATLGSGSLTTIYKHLEAWEATRKPLMIEIPETVKGASPQAWQAAALEAGKKVAAIREKADTEVKAHPIRAIYGFSSKTVICTQYK